MSMRTRTRLSIVVFVAAILTASTLTPGTAQNDVESDAMRLLSNSPRTAAVSQSDLAFWGELAFVGYYDGFRILDISRPRNLRQVVDVACRNNQGDVSVWNGLLIVSIDQPVSAPDCSGVDIGSSHPAWPGWEGIRIFDVSDPANTGPDDLIAAVATDCGSHTHTLIPDLENDRILVYVSSNAGTQGDSAYGTSCRRLNPDGSQGHSKISIVEIPLDDPASASVINEPYFEMVDFRGTPGARGCHDIGVFLELELAAAACHGEGQLWDISDPVNPVTVRRFHHPSVDIWHSGGFSYDGEIIVFGDEFAGGGGPGCDDPDDDIGRIYFYPVDGDELLGTYKIPRAQNGRICTMHNYNMIPTVLGRYLVSASNMGGTTMVDFTDPANAHEIAFFDANPPDGPNTFASPWSSYWYRGYIYANDRARGVDALQALYPKAAATYRFRYLNPQTQEEVIPLRVR